MSKEKCVVIVGVHVPRQRRYQLPPLDPAGMLPFS